MSKYFRWAEVKTRDDVYADVGTTRWGNRDLYPIPKEERTFGWLDYFLFWATLGVSVSEYTLGSAYIAYGLSAGETSGAILLGCCLSSVYCFFCSRPGLDHKLGFTMTLRATFGMWGSTFPLAFFFLGGIVFSGLQSYYGGLAVSLIISAVIPQFNSLENTLPLSAAITTKNLIGLIIFFLIFMPIVQWVPPHRINKLLYPSFFMITGTLFGLLGWAIHTNHGSAGDLVHSKIHLSAATRAFRIVQCASSITGTWCGAAERLSDWTRFSKSRHAPTPSMILATPITLTICSLIGILVTSATYEVYGTLMWNPLTLLDYVQQNSYTPACRAATFFAGISILSSQIFLTYTQDVIPWGMDITGLLPRYLTIKRASILLCVFALAANPWRFLSQAYIFVEILSVVSIFAAASAGILVADYWIIRKKKWVIPHLYQGNSESTYWYTHGWNWRAVGAMIFGMWPSIPGLAYSIKDATIENAWVRMFEINYFIGAPLAFLTFIAVSLIWPPAGSGVQVDLLDGAEVIEGGSIEVNSLEKGENTVKVGEMTKRVSLEGGSV